MAIPLPVDREPSVELRSSSRHLVALAMLVLLVGAAAGLWELFAGQAPYTPLRAPQLEGPVAQLRSSAFVVGLLLLAAAWLLPWIEPDEEPHRWVGAVTLGTSVMLLALAYGASTSMMGTQIFDPRPDATALFAGRALGQGLLGLCLVDFSRRVFVKLKGNDS